MGGPVQNSRASGHSNASVATIATTAVAKSKKRKKDRTEKQTVHPERTAQKMSVPSGLHATSVTSEWHAKLFLLPGEFVDFRAAGLRNTRLHRRNPVEVEAIKTSQVMFFSKT